MTDATPPWLKALAALADRFGCCCHIEPTPRTGATRNVAENSAIQEVAEVADDRNTAAAPLQSDIPRRRPICAGCDRPLRVCVCDALPRPPLALDTPVIIWQHPNEAKRRVATASLLALCLSDDSREIARGRSFNAVTECALWRRCVLGEGRVPLLLWPEPGAEHIGDVPKESRFVLIVIIDGTWKEAAEMRKRAGAACLTVHVGDGVTGLFAERKPPADGCLSSIEAAAVALDLLEPLGAGEVLAALRRPMLRVVEMQAALAKRVVHRPERPGYRPNLEEEVREALLQV